jgi:hypothetical protein
LDVIKSPAVVNDLPAERDILKLNLRRIGGAPDPDKKGLAYMNQVLLTLLEEIVWEQPEEKHHPAVRYNCMLILGDLNSREVNLGGSGTPQPMAEAEPILLKGLVDPTTNDAVKIASLIGLKRHAELGIIDKTFEKQVVTDLCKVLATKETPGNRTDEAHLVFRRRATELLGVIGRAGYNQNSTEVVEQLQGVLADAAQPLPLRSDAARALGRFVHKAPGPDLEVFTAVGSLVVEGTKQETTKAGYKHYLRSALLAVHGLEGQTADPKRGMIHNLGPAQKKFVDEFVKRLNDLWVAADKTQELQLQEKMKTDGVKLDEFLKQKPAVAAAGGQ